MLGSNTPNPSRIPTLVSQQRAPDGKCVGSLGDGLGMTVALSESPPLVRTRTELLSGEAHEPRIPSVPEVLQADEGHRLVGDMSDPPGARRRFLLGNPLDPRVTAQVGVEHLALAHPFRHRRRTSSHDNPNTDK